ncbi:MAG: hypothetical protein WC455_11870 [Dehalococcoidia bacterium]
MPDIKVNIDEAERVKLGAELLEKIESSRNGMKKLLDNIKTWERFFESDLPEKNDPWEKCSNINVPIIQPDVDTFHSNINGVVLGVSPIVNVVPPPFAADATLKQVAQRVEAAIETVQTAIMNYAQAADQWHLTALMHPSAVIKLPWREEYRTVKRQQVDKKGTNALIDVQEIKYRGPRIETVDINNFVIYPLTAKSIEDAYLVGDRFVLTEDEVNRRVKDGYFDAVPAKEVMKRPENELTSSLQDFSNDERNDQVGIENVDIEQYYFWEVIAPYDVNKDGLMEECVFVLEATTGTIVRATQFPYFHGRRYYVSMAPFLKSVKMFFKRCLPQILEHMQREANAIHNQRADATTQAINKAFKVRKGSLDNPDSIDISPGGVTELDDINDLVEFTLSPVIPGVDLQEMNRSNSERASGINDMTTGRQSEGNKTLGELQMVMAKAGSRFEDVIRRVQGAHVEVAKQIAGLMYQFMTDDELKMLNIEREMLIFPWDFIPHGSVGTVDKNMEFQRASNVYKTMITDKNPLVVSNPLHIYRLTRDYLQSLGTTDVESYIGTEQEIQLQIKQAQMQQQAQAVAMGMAQAPQFDDPQEAQAFEQMVAEARNAIAMQQEQGQSQQQLEQAKLQHQSAENQADREAKLQLESMRQGRRL